jgi:hypothetical protein
MVAIKIQLKPIPFDYKLKIGASAISLFLANFCYAIIDKNHPEKSYELLEDIKKTAAMLLEKEHSQKIKTEH